MRRTDKRRSCVEILRFYFIAVFLSILLFSLNAGVAQAVLIPWSTNASGTGNGFYWLNGGSDKGLFNNPTLIDGHILRFSWDADEFIAQSLNGKSALKSDRLQVDIIAKTGFVIQGIKVGEYGAFGINTAGRVSAGGAIFITNLAHYEVRSAVLLMNPGMPISTPPGNPNWGGQAAIDELNWTHFRIVINNNLLAASQPGSNSFINKTSFDLDVPEPATIAILTIGCFSLPVFGKKNKCL